MIVAAVTEIRKVVLMAVGLALESNVVIGLHPVAIFQGQHQPFRYVPYEERQIEQFALLSHVYQLVVQFVVVHLVRRQYQLAQRDGQEVTAKRKPLNFQNLWHKQSILMSDSAKLHFFPEKLF